MIGAPKEDEVLPIPKHVHNVDAILNERHQQYGRFIDVAAAEQSIKEALKSLPNWNLLGDDQKECLEMIASKVARISTVTQITLIAGLTLQDMQSLYPTDWKELSDSTK